MDTIFMNSKNSQITDPHRILLNLSDNMYVKKSDKYIIFSNLSICHAWKNIKISCKTICLKHQPRSLCQSYRDKQRLDGNGAIAHFTADNGNNSVLFKFKQKVTVKTGNGGTKDVEIMLPLKNLNNFWRTLEMPLISCEINFILTWWVDYFIVAGAIDDQVTTFATTDTKFYVTVVTLSI